MVKISPLYCVVIFPRWDRFTGRRGKAVIQTSEKLFGILANLMLDN